MYEIKIKNNKFEQKSKINNIKYADSFYKRLIGLMGKYDFNGLIFKQKYGDRISGSIHTCFMKKSIDVIYISQNMQIQEIITLKSWKLYIPKKGNIKYIIELPENSITKHDIKLGDKVVINHEKP